MRSFNLLVTAFLASSALAAAFSSQTIPAGAEEETLQTCPSFVSTVWVSPLAGPKASGNRYTVAVDGNAMPCAQAIAWAKKLIPQHIAGKPLMPTYPPLKGGPPGYVCKGSPDTKGHAWRGNCFKNTTTAIPAGFTWTND
ncbi:MAG TPA: hypothetical protein VGZ02_12925 [Candidatus Baltobacteraceae bacterium]|jgi:hypothetical protein|nr:hypothetical protein [Candidatus Baltobacteraceae bacterium]